MDAPTKGGRREGAGRPAKSAAGRGSAVSLWLKPEERAHLERLGGGSANDGLRVLIAASMPKPQR